MFTRTLILLSVLFLTAQSWATEPKVSAHQCSDWTFDKEGGFENEPAAILECKKSGSMDLALVIICSEDTMYIFIDPIYLSNNKRSGDEDWAALTISAGVQDKVEIRDWVPYSGLAGMYQYSRPNVGLTDPFIKFLSLSDEMQIGFTDNGVAHYSFGLSGFQSAYEKSCRS